MLSTCWISSKSSVITSGAWRVSTTTALHWVSVAVRESVVNAIKHGNQNDESKRVVVEFTPVPAHDPDELVIRVEDEGEGFDPEEIADPLAPENILKSSGRGIFLIRSFMDDVELQRGARRAAWKCAWSRRSSRTAPPPRRRVA